jgi:hypothetical protein
MLMKSMAVPAQLLEDGDLVSIEPERPPPAPAP